ncbi:hypothetical protein LPB136_03275 [Tenacibaculum todarodis]|uniref:DUF4258 domain-containing protein n=1 Tax=Tenacibaculum todarodis TaxID=1850252 RepID=A0A1L3JH50_9FLAO|nr:DUF4258 domain-containing protein [Tenacibaculum todarodis]APG64442.1 hypothetical protein LPB136_03275 [Tenacibaculum todarodis]
MLKRFFYYLIGLSLGSLIVYFFWTKKDVTFNYGMDARTLKTIRIRERLYSDEAKLTMAKHNIDSLQIATVLENGDVNFGKSKARIKPCPEYYVTGKKLDLYIIRCDSTSTIKNITIKSN